MSSVGRSRLQLLQQLCKTSHQLSATINHGEINILGFRQIRCPAQCLDNTEQHTAAGDAGCVEHQQASHSPSLQLLLLSHATS
jgi:hypothetical protein